MRPWEESIFSAESKERSLSEARDRLQQLREEDARRDWPCRCEAPVPGRVYLGHRKCAVCNRLIEEGVDARPI